MGYASVILHNHLIDMDLFRAGHRAAQFFIYMLISLLYRNTRSNLSGLLRHIMLGAFASVLLAGCGDPPPFHATDITGATFGRDFRLTDHTGRRVASADFRGKAMVIFFGYTQCPDICPTALTTMKEAMRLLGPEADRVQVLFVTVDPERDTPEVLAAYVPWFDSRFLGLYGDAATTRDTAREFRVLYSKVEGGTALGYSIDHSATSYAYDPQGRLRLLMRHDAAPGHIAADLRRLLAGE